MSRAARWLICFLCSFVVLIVAMVLDSGPLYFVGAFVLTLPFASMALGWNFLRDLELSLLHPSTAMAGDLLELTFQVQNRGALPAFHLGITPVLPAALDPKQVPLAGAAFGPLPELSVLPVSQTKPELHENAPEADLASMVSIEHIPGNARIAARGSVRALRRGVFAVGPVILSYLDPLRLSVVRVLCKKSVEAVVYPRPLDVEVAVLMGGDLLGADRAFRRQGSTDGVDFYGVRPYRPGDDRRRIHWRTTARVGKLMVVEREPFAALALTLVIDLKAEGGASEERPDGSFSASASEPPLEALIRLGARMVEEMVRRTITLSILRLHPDGTISTAARRCASWIEGMDTLARIDKATSTEDPATPPRFPISPDQIGDSMSAGAVVVLLTDRMDERIVALQRACRSSARECAVVLFSPGDRGRLPGDLADGLRSSHDFTAGSLWLLRPRTETPDAITPASNSKSRDRVDAPGVSVQEPNWMREYDLEPVARR